MSERGRDVSHELTEVRTVLGMAENALRRLRYMSDDRLARGSMSYYGARDPDYAEMVCALTQATEKLSKWRKTGRTKSDSNA